MVKKIILENSENKKSFFHEEKLNLKENKIIIKKEDLNTKEANIDTLNNADKSMGSRDYKIISKTYFKKINIAKDGNCYFCCLSYYFENNQDKWRIYRRQIYSIIKTKYDNIKENYPYEIKYKKKFIILIMILQTIQKSHF